MRRMTAIVQANASKTIRERRGNPNRGGIGGQETANDNERVSSPLTSREWRDDADCPGQEHE